MKALNAYYRKHKTAKGFDGISDEVAAKIDNSINNGYSYERRQPYQPWAIQNNNQNIIRIKERIAKIRKIHEQNGATSNENTPKVYDGFRIEQNAAVNRIRIYFDAKPDEQTRILLKSRGFRWSPNAGAWQRQLNGNGLYAARRIAETLAPDGSKNSGETARACLESNKHA